MVAGFSRHLVKIRSISNLTPQPPSLRRKGENSKPSQEKERGLERGFPDPVKSKGMVGAGLTITVTAFGVHAGKPALVKGISYKIHDRNERNLIMNFTANIPDALYQQVVALAKRENISIEQLVIIALSAWIRKDYIEEKAKQGRWDKFQQVLHKVPDVEPEPYDRF